MFSLRTRKKYCREHEQLSWIDVINVYHWVGGRDLKVGDCDGQPNLVTGTRWCMRSLMDNRELMPWLQLRFDFDSTAVRPHFDRSTLRPTSSGLRPK